MTITQRSSGIIFYDPLTQLGNWKPVTDFTATPGGATYSTAICGVYQSAFFDTSVNSSGSAWALFYACFEAYGYFQQQINLPAGAVFRINYRTISGPQSGRSLVAALRVGSSSFGTTASSTWKTVKGTLPAGLQQIQIGYAYALSPDTSGANAEICVADLYICSSNNVTVTGLAVGQKVELYEAGTTYLIGSGSVAANTTSATISVAAETFPEQMYAKIYAADGATLIETTPAYQMAGGDVWVWTAPQVISVTVDNFQIYQKNAIAPTPKIAVITATLTQLISGNPPYVGKNLNFATSLGTLSASSAVTDANGHAVVSLTSTQPGLAVVQVTWTGDATVSAATGFVIIHVFNDAPIPDPTQPFQLYIEGTQYPYVAGTAGTSHYGQNYQQKIETFSVVLQRWYPSITKRGIVQIYRYGVLEYAGILEIIKRSIGTQLQILLSGSDASKLLDGRVIDEALYTNKSPEYIINDLLANYQCGITAGQLGVSGITLPSVLFTDVTLRAAIQQICNLVGWTYRVNPNLSLDFAAQFGGGTSAATFNEGDRVGDAMSQLDYSTIGNRIHMIGSGITSIQSDSDSINEIGLSEQLVFQKTVTDASTLAIACQAALADSENTELTAQITVRDSNPPGTFNPQDSITVNIPDLDLAGLYTVVRIQRDLCDPTIATVDLGKRLPELWELDETSLRMLSDLSAGITLAA